MSTIAQNPQGKNNILTKDDFLTIRIVLKDRYRYVLEKGGGPVHNAGFLAELLTLIGKLDELIREAKP